MKRNQYGINFDLGIPLRSEEEFQLLYVDLFREQKQLLHDWIEDKNAEPIIVAGQIGSGKTTLIEKTFRQCAVQSDIYIHLDTEVPIYTIGAFWGVFLGKVIQYAQLQKCDLKPFHLSQDFLPVINKKGGLAKLVKALCDRPQSIKEFTDKKQLFRCIEDHLDYLKHRLPEIIQTIEKKINRKLFIFADGIDKFNRFKAEFFLLEDLLTFLSQYKTLYEVNFIHMIGTISGWRKNSKRLWLTGAEHLDIAEILSRRLGVYTPSRKEIIPLLAGLSGGNLRQALRLLIEYDYAIEKKNSDPKQALDYACLRVKDDLLNLPSGNINLELLKVVHRDKYIADGTLRDLSASDGSPNAIYQNWILITGEADAQLNWPATINPLLLPALESFKHVPDAPEVSLLKKWAENHDISPFGLEIAGSMAGKNAFFDAIGSEREMKTLNIQQIFERMASFFLNHERRDKIIIAYNNLELAHLANDFMIGKAGTYAPGNFVDIEFLDFQEGQLDFFLDRFRQKDIVGFSIFFNQRIPDKSLATLEQRRDVFINDKMIWWIPISHLYDYLRSWPQLRQFFNIFRLEEDILSHVSIAEVEEDLEDIDIIDSSNTNNSLLKKRLRRVLEYLKK